MAPYTKLAVRSLGPTKAVTREEHAKMPGHAPPPPARGSRLRELVERVVIFDGWQDHAACTAHPDVVFFAEERSPINVYDAARVICEVCPVREACLEYALRTHEPAGFWGGKTPRERDDMRKTRGFPRSTRVGHGVYR